MIFFSVEHPVTAHRRITARPFQKLRVVCVGELQEKQKSCFLSLGASLRSDTGCKSLCTPTLTLVDLCLHRCRVSYLSCVSFTCDHYGLILHLKAFFKGTHFHAFTLHRRMKVCCYQGKGTARRGGIPFSCEYRSKWRRLRVEMLTFIDIP